MDGDAGAELMPSDRYEWIQRIGSGAFGSVWLVRDRALEDQVAIKVLAAEHARQPEMRDRFAQEARLLRRVRSDRVVSVHDIGELADGRPYFVMAYADGGTLEQRLASASLSVPAAFTIAIEAARAVAVLHQYDLVHRDVKPSNILFASAGSAPERLLMGDLGLARSATQADQQTLIAGTPAYMAPEQATGSNITPATDVYALGVLTFRLLTGAVPKDATSIDGVLHRALDTVLTPSAVQPGIPTAVDELITRALSSDPKQRQRDATQFADELVAATSTGDEPTDPVSTVAGLTEPDSPSIPPRQALQPPEVLPNPTPKNTRLLVSPAEPADDDQTAQMAEPLRTRGDKRRRNRILVAIATVLALVISGVAIELKYDYLSILPKLGSSSQTPDGSASDSSTPDFPYIAETLSQHTDTVRHMAFNLDGRRLASVSGEHIVLWNVVDDNSVTLTGHTGPVSMVTFDGVSALASADDGGTVRLWDMATGENTVTLTGDSVVNDIAFSPDGTVLAVADGNSLNLWDVATGQGTALSEIGYAYTNLKFSPDGASITGVGGDWYVRMWDVASGQNTAVLDGTSWSDFRVVIGPDATTVANADGDGAVRIWNVATGQGTGAYSAKKGVEQGLVVFSPDGKTIATTDDGLTVNLWDVTTNENTITLAGHAGSLERIAFSTDGKRIATSGADNVVSLWDPATGENTAWFNDTGDILLSPDGNTIAVSDDEDYSIRLWQLDG